MVAHRIEGGETGYNSEFRGGSMGKEWISMMWKNHFGFSHGVENGSYHL